MAGWRTGREQGAKACGMASSSISRSISAHARGVSLSPPRMDIAAAGGLARAM